MEEKFEEIKGEINRYISNMPIIPERVEEIIKKMFERLSEYYQLYFENDPSISETILEYIEGIRNEALTYLRKPQGANYNLIDEYYGDIQNILMKIEDKIECGEKTTNRDIEGIDLKTTTTKTKGAAIQHTRTTVKDSIGDIISHVSSIMYNREYSDGIISTMQERAMQWTGRLMNNLSEERIDGEYSAVASDLESHVQKRLSELIEQRTNPAETFRNSMDAGLSLEDQYTFIQILNSQEPTINPENNIEISGVSGDEYTDKLMDGEDGLIW